MPTNSIRILNVGLQSATLGTRFLFIFFLAKYLDPQSVGYYGLFSAAIGYCLYFVGLDFYTYVTREILSTPNEIRGQMLKGQANLSAILYIVLLPLILLFLINSGWPGNLPFWFLPILLLEHFNQEMSRLLVALSEQITASVILFVRQGSWAVIAVGLLTWDESCRQLDVVIALWACAGVAAAFFGIMKLKRLKIGGWRVPVNWTWIKRGISVSAAFLFATLALRGMQTLDRYWLEALGGVEIVGAYVIFLGVAGSMLAFLDAGIFAYAYPALIKNHFNNETAAARAKIRQVLIQTLIFAGAFSLISWLVLPFLLEWIGNPVYQNASDLYPWLLLATVLNALSMVPHFALYAQGQDKPIIYSHVASFGMFVVATWLLTERFGTLAVPLGLNFAFGIILVWKSWAYWQLCKNQSASKRFSSISRI